MTCIVRRTETEEMAVIIGANLITVINSRHWRHSISSSACPSDFIISLMKSLGMWSNATWWAAGGRSAIFKAQMGLRAERRRQEGQFRERNVINSSHVQMPFKFGRVWQSPSIVYQCDAGERVLFGGLRERRKLGQTRSLIPWLKHLG